MPPTQILISAGEASGDMYAARLAAALRARADVQLFGMGGTRMRDAGVELVADVADFSVGGVDIWTYDLAQSTAERVTFEPGAESWPVWSRSRSRVAPSVATAGAPTLPPPVTRFLCVAWNSGAPSLELEFEHTSAFRWLSDNARTFGFFLSFPRQNPYGYAYEPWHWCFRPTEA